MGDPRCSILAHLSAGSVGAEVGVHLGDFSALMLELVHPNVLHLIDPWLHRREPEYVAAWYGGMVEGQREMDLRHKSVCERFARQIADGQVVVHRGRSRDMLGNMPDGALDWIYIDGDHLYENVRTDLSLSFRKVRAGGLIIGDDYGAEGWWRNGVTKAVDEALQANPAELLDIQASQYVIRLPAENDTDR
ncbi:MAG: class I SAM-dependent methyltransferase [Pseudomonadota bacterium]